MYVRVCICMHECVGACGGHVVMHVRPCQSFYRMASVKHHRGTSEGERLPIALLYCVQYFVVWLWLKNGGR